MILDEIVAHKKKEVARQQEKESRAKLEEKIANLRPARDFKSALEGEGVNLIAEVKKASPSRGVIREDFNPRRIANQYEQAGASALSVLTDEEFFGGQLEYLTRLKEAVDLPLLRKDFIISPYQLYQARVYGADAVLLIGAILTAEQARDYFELAQKLGLDVLFEVHDGRELELALDIGAEIIGINNRDLEVFAVDLATTRRLTKEIPADKLIVSESGIKERADVEYVAESGGDAVLVGEALMRAESIAAKIKELTSVS